MQNLDCRTSEGFTNGDNNRRFAMQIRKDYGRQLGALAASTIVTGAVWLWVLPGANPLLMLAIWVGGYAAAYNASVKQAAMERIADGAVIVETKKEAK